MIWTTQLRRSDTPLNFGARSKILETGSGIHRPLSIEMLGRCKAQPEPDRRWPKQDCISLHLRGCCCPVRHLFFLTQDFLFDQRHPQKSHRRCFTLLFFQNNFHFETLAQQYSFVITLWRLYYCFYYSYFLLLVLDENQRWLLAVDCRLLPLPFLFLLALRQLGLSQAPIHPLSPSRSLFCSAALSRKVNHINTNSRTFAAFCDSHPSKQTKLGGKGIHIITSHADQLFSGTSDQRTSSPFKTTSFDPAKPSYKLWSSAKQPKPSQDQSLRKSSSI